MATVGENQLLTQILAQGSDTNAKVSAMAETVARLDERVKTTVDSSIDHEDRLRKVESGADQYVTKAQVRWWFLAALTAWGAISTVVSALVSRS